MAQAQRVRQKLSTGAGSRTQTGSVSKAYCVTSFSNETMIV